jgi:hypothetical protein
LCSGLDRTTEPDATRAAPSRAFGVAVAPLESPAWSCHDHIGDTGWRDRFGVIACLPHGFARGTGQFTDEVDAGRLKPKPLIEALCS